jgi:hypothetical protein
MKTLTAILHFLRSLSPRRRQIHANRSAGAKKGWAKRKAKPEVPHDVQ